MNVQNKNKIIVLDCPIDNISMEKTIEIINASILKDEQLVHQVVDAGKLAHMKKDPNLYNHVIKSDIINVDGQSVVLISRLYKNKFCQRITDIDLFQRLLEFSFMNNYKIYLFGSTKNVLLKVCKKIAKDYSEQIVAGYQDEDYKIEDEKLIVKSINESGAKLLFVGIGTPKEEAFIDKYRNSLNNIKFITGINESFDIYAGEIKRLPKWMHKLCLEWFYRFIQNPKKKLNDEVLESIQFFIYLLKRKIKSKHEFKKWDH